MLPRLLLLPLPPPMLPRGRKKFPRDAALLVRVRARGEPLVGESVAVVSAGWGASGAGDCESAILSLSSLPALSIAGGCVPVRCTGVYARS